MTGEPNGGRRTGTNGGEREAWERRRRRSDGERVSDCYLRGASDWQRSYGELRPAVRRCGFCPNDGGGGDWRR